MADLITAMQAIFTYLMGLFGDAFETITGNPILYLPILVALAGGAILSVIALIRRFGVRGVGRRRRRRA